MSTNIPICVGDQSLQQGPSKILGFNTVVVHSGADATEVDDATDDRLWDLTDGLGSVRAQADDTGVVTGAADYDVWGTELSSTTSSLFSWTGEQNDDETGLTYLRNRYYSPTYSRFLSPEPIQPNAGGTQGFNAYAYARNNPATLTDPSGMLAGSDVSDIANSKLVSRSKAIIGCMLKYNDIVSETACVLPLLGLTGENIRRAGRSIRDFANDHPCTEQCINIVKWSAIVVAVAIIATTIIAACFPYCMVMMVGLVTAPEAGAAAGTAGLLVSRQSQIQLGLRAITQYFSKVPEAERAVGRSWLVYRYVDRSGVVRYIGRTSNYTQRAAWWARTRGWRIEKIAGLKDLVLVEARGVEQRLIEYHGFNGQVLPNGRIGTLYNLINSIAKSSPIYNEATRRADIILRAAEHEGFT